MIKIKDMRSNLVIRCKRFIVSRLFGRKFCQEIISAWILEPCINRLQNNSQWPSGEYWYWILEPCLHWLQNDIKWPSGQYWFWILEPYLNWLQNNSKGDEVAKMSSNETYKVRKNLGDCILLQGWISVNIKWEKDHQFLQCGGGSAQFLFSKSRIQRKFSGALWEDWPRRRWGGLSQVWQVLQSPRP